MKTWVIFGAGGKGVGVTQQRPIVVAFAIAILRFKLTSPLRDSVLALSLVSYFCYRQ
ncbi:hypothetical protein QF204_06020 [Proteus faecis]|uniref:hypothetical protein n=1 Tax=Proteus faecis TaxID=2050967 RepID=UPI00257B1785|nr:hypothetical protein [Proteus faecis]MDM3867728.1 hypothetical protein [Proteus faecis]